MVLRMLDILQRRDDKDVREGVMCHRCVSGVITKGAEGIQCDTCQHVYETEVKDKSNE